MYFSNAVRPSANNSSPQPSAPPEKPEPVRTLPPKPEPSTPVPAPSTVPDTTPQHDPGDVPVPFCPLRRES